LKHSCFTYEAKILKLFKKFGLQKRHHYGKSTFRKQNPKKLLLPLCPLDNIKVHYKTDLFQEVKKKIIEQTVKKLAVLTTIHTTHPEKDWLHAYTDISLTDKNGNVGA
jgi:hypothetical protein